MTLAHERLDALGLERTKRPQGQTETDDPRDRQGTRVQGHTLGNYRRYLCHTLINASSTRPTFTSTTLHVARKRDLLFERQVSKSIINHQFFSSRSSKIRHNVPIFTPQSTSVIRFIIVARPIQAAVAPNHRFILDSIGTISKHVGRIPFRRQSTQQSSCVQCLISI